MRRVDWQIKNPWQVVRDFEPRLTRLTRIDEGLKEFPELESQAGIPHTSGDVSNLRRTPVTLLAGTHEHDRIMIFEEGADFTQPEKLAALTSQNGDAIHALPRRKRLGKEHPAHHVTAGHQHAGKSKHGEHPVLRQ